MKVFISLFLISLLLLARRSYCELPDESLEAEDIEIEDQNDDVTYEKFESVKDVPYVTPSVPAGGGVYFSEHFDSIETFNQKWIKSEAKKEGIDESIAKYDGVWEIEAATRDPLKGDLGLVLKSKAKHAAIAAKLDRPFVFKEKPLVVQYEAMFQDGQECGGAYIKLLSVDKDNTDLKKFHDKTPYTIMFGPDKCASDYKLHFIFRHKNPLNGSVTEKHSKKPKERLDEPYTDKTPHLYTLIVRPDNTFQVYLDHKVVNEGSLLEDFTPPVNPPAEIDDPTDVKPKDWDEREKIPDADVRKPDDWDENAPQMIKDTSAKKPEGWLDDEPENIPDPSAEKPSDWDEEMDGEWEAPLIPNPLCEDGPGCGPWSPPDIPNPAYKGKWVPPLIDNPNYQGKWAPRRIPNPDFFEDKEPFKMTSIFSVGLELWSMSNQILFDNFIITDDPNIADHWAAQTFDLKRKKIDKDSTTMWVTIMKHINQMPGWWIAYFCYCLTPIFGYAWYLSWRVKKESLVAAVMKYTNDHPWLYAVYIVVIGLPLVLLFVFFCGGSSQEKEDIRKATESKKTDEPGPDDEVEETGQSGITELPEEEEEEEEEEEGEELKDTKEEQTTEETKKENEELLDQDTTGSGDAPSSPRKRKIRKD